MARKPVPAAILAAQSRLQAASIEFQAVDNDHLRVGAFLFWPVSGFWKAIDGSRQGYTVRKLIEAIREVPVHG